MIFILCFSILLLILIIVFLSLAIFLILKKTNYFSKKEKDFIVFVIDVFAQYGNDYWGIQSDEQYQKIISELNIIKDKIQNEKK